MSQKSWMPRNAAPILNLRLQGKAPAFGVVVSYVGDTPYQGLAHVFCDSGRRYDFGFLAGLQAIIVVRPGVDASDAIRKLWKLYLEESTPLDGFPILVDIQTERLAWISSDNPRAWMFAMDSHEAMGVLLPWRRSAQQQGAAPCSA